MKERVPWGTVSVRWKWAALPAARGAGEAARGVGGGEGGGETSWRSKVRRARTFSKSPRVEGERGGGEAEREGVRAGVGGGEGEGVGVGRAGEGV